MKCSYVEKEMRKRSFGWTSLVQFSELDAETRQTRTTLTILRGYIVNEYLKLNIRAASMTPD